jgi:hypothetical protein
MLTAINGTYMNGQVILEHKPTMNMPAKVLVIFEEETPKNQQLKKRTFGIAKGTIVLSPDFNEPLEDL